MTEAIGTPRAPTRERILDAAVDLFGRQGYHGTSVGEIESAAGLSPRSGALYKHFPSKSVLLEEAVRRRTREVEELEAMATATMRGDARTELELLGRLTLHAIGEDQPMLRIVMKEGDNFPELRDAFRERIVRRGHETAIAWIRRVIARAGRDADEIDVEAVAAVMLGPLINYRVLDTLFGEPPGGIGEERFMAAWTQAGLRLLEAYGLIPDAEEAQAR